MTDYKCKFNLGQVLVSANNRQEAKEKAAILLGLGRKWWMITAFVDDGGAQPAPAKLAQPSAKK
jgi:hypothetical protein